MPTALAALLAAGLLARPAHAGVSRSIRIGIVPKAETLTVSCAGPCTATDAEGRAHELEPGRAYAVEAAEDGLRLGPLLLADEVRVRAASASEPPRVGERRARGTLLLLRAADGTLTAIDELGIEEYLLGVLPHEMDPAWPLEALKAQAVVARTFAYTQLGKFKRSGFDLTSDTRSQMYGGAGADDPAVRRAVTETRGEVLGYEGRILNVYYHSCCGGHTADANAIWPSGEASPKPLRGVRDRWCQASPHYRWTAYFTETDALAALSRAGFMGTPLSAFSIGRVDAAGVVRDFVARVGSEVMRVKANDFRNWIGNRDFKSTRVDRVRRLSKGIEFRGRGMGHGVGLCQWGARAQAERGRGYAGILRFYFPGSTLSVVDE